MYVSHPSWFHDAAMERSGTMRAFSEGIPGPVCHAGFGKRMLIPPVLLARPNRSGLSFQPFSGMYDIAEPPFAVVVVFQYVPPASSNSVPPMAVISGTDAGNWIASPRVAWVRMSWRSQPAAPVSPVLTTHVMHCEFACCAKERNSGAVLD